MSFFKSQSDQARVIFAAMPLQSRIIMGMLLVAIGVGLAFLVSGSNTRRTVPLFGGRSLSEQEMASMEMAFSRNGLNDWDREGTRISVPADTKSEYLAVLEGSTTLPMSIRSNVEDAIDKASVFDSTDMRRSREQYAREKDLADAIMKFSDIRTATIAYDRGQRQGFSRTPIQSATVVIQPIGSEPLSRRRIRMLQEMVRGAYSGMTAEDVVVTDLNGTSTSMVDDDDPMLRKQREAELIVENKIRNVLVGYPARVAVLAEIDPSMDAEKTTVSYDATPTTLASDSKKVESSNFEMAVGGEPGVVPNAVGNRPQSLSEPVETSKLKQDERQTRSVTGQTFENTRSASLQVKNVRVTVGLPRSYYENLLVRAALKRDPNTKPEDVDISDPVELERLRTETEKNIQSAVTPLLPELSAGADPADLVHVWEYPDPAPEPQPPSQTATAALTWLANSWQTLALVGLALVALLVARSAATAATATPTEFAEGFGLELPEPPVVEAASGREDTMSITGASLQDELKSIVDENPDVAANVIRGWIGEAA